MELIKMEAIVHTHSMLDMEGMTSMSALQSFCKTLEVSIL